MDKAAKAAFSFFLYVLPPAGCGKKRGPGGRRARNARTTPRDRGLRPRSLGVGLGVQGAQGAPGPQTPPPPGPRFFYGADDAILEESPGAAGDSVQGG